MKHKEINTAQIYINPAAFVLESGISLQGLQIAYHSYGQLNPEKNNVIWICHALTANSDAADWWPGMIGAGCVFDPEKYFIVCANILGSCFGSTGPLCPDPATGMPRYQHFPAITIKDMVRAHILLRQHLGIDDIYMMIGGSMGGYQALEWTLMEPARIHRLFLLATSAAESAWGIAIHTAQRMAIEADGSYGKPEPAAGAMGMKAARAMGMVTYRNYELMNLQQTDTDKNKTDHFRASSYLQHQGNKLAERFNAYSYYTISKALDTHNISRGREGTVADVLQTIMQPVLLIGISSDLLCPVAEQKEMARHIPDCRYEEIDSMYGHDGFLIEHEAISAIVRDWLN
jgi:homoserine O-acetyltransferase